METYSRLSERTLIDQFILAKRIGERFYREVLEEASSLEEKDKVIEAAKAKYDKIEAGNYWDAFSLKPVGKGWCFDADNGKWFRIRKLTPRECFRLMDVPENHIDDLMAVDEEGKQIISNSQLYKCAGNSIVVSPMALTFENLFFPPEGFSTPEVTEENEDDLFRGLWD